MLSKKIAVKCTSVAMEPPVASTVMEAGSRDYQGLLQITAKCECPIGMTAFVIVSV